MNALRTRVILLIGCLTASLALAQTLEPRPSDASLQAFEPVKAPQPTRLMLKQGDRLAICGDSITEQKRYSRLMEDYLTVCVPELNVTVRQFGWGGETAAGFLGRMTNDCLGFKPTIATTCYGMNDHEYRPYEASIGRRYRTNTQAIVEAFKAHGARVILGSPGCVGKVPSWRKNVEYTTQDLNLNLCKLRNIDVEIAQQDKVGFADVFWPMLTTGVAAQREYGTNYAICGHDGVHPGWAGHTVMAYAFLKAMGLKGDIGTFVVDLPRTKMKVSKGHKLLSEKDGVFQITSSRYPFCCCVPSEDATDPYPVCSKDDPQKADSICSAMTLLPFDADLNRLMLVGKNPAKTSYKVTWGDQSKTYTADELTRGINLAKEFPDNPFSAAFARVDAAVAAKQDYETRQIKQDFHSQQAQTNMQAVVERTEAERAPLEAAIKAAFMPVTHTITIEAE